VKFGLLAIAIFAGVLNPFLGGMNSTLGKRMNQPYWAVVATFAVAMSAALVAALTTHQRFPNISRIANAPWWSWLGGLFAVGFVLSLTLVAQKLGASVFTGITVTVGMIVAIVLDHYGVVGYEVHKLSVLRIAGALVMTGGLAIILKS
jgi:bacterial/archaeal transporter family-2 protein